MNREVSGGILNWRNCISEISVFLKVLIQLDGEGVPETSRVSGTILPSIVLFSSAFGPVADSKKKVKAWSLPSESLWPRWENASFT